VSNSNITVKTRPLCAKLHVKSTSFTGTEIQLGRDRSWPSYEQQVLA